MVTPDPGQAPGKTIFVRYLADIWVEVAPDGEILSAVVDVDSMAKPAEVINADGSPAQEAVAEAAIRAARSGEWPSWDYRARPFRPTTR